ncbi:SMI1/KNR4 family protein [Paenibacillus caui]|uniref:SMI1/KNR4 family protein n=1 Tax=Paenibacillus caui TaxID=2873927 RepID=UPI001CA85314|nr:SMI1/KNR4 family protein [Paenibacillus caui]
MEDDFQFILKWLHQRIELEEGRIKILGSDGKIYSASFVFNPPATINTIRQLENKYQIRLPKDYATFLSIHNGAKLFDIGNGDCTQIYSIDEVDNLAEIMMPEIAPNLLPIARYPGIKFYLDLTRKNNNIFSNESGPDFDFLAMNFTKWFSALIQTNGSPFWDLTPQMVYRIIDDPELKLKDWLLNGYQ